MNAIFHIVYSMLMWVSDVTGLTYNEVNIVVYYIVLPFAYVFLADKILKTHILKISYAAAIAVALYLIEDFTTFSDRAFQASVQFLQSLEFFGWNYVISSVLICVIFPAIVFMGMLHLAYPGLYRSIAASFFKRRLTDWGEEDA